IQLSIIYSKNRPMVDPAVFKCISMLANAVGQALTRHMHELLELMFATGLSEPLRQSLVDLSHCIPQLLPMIQDRLLDMLSLILSGQTYKPPGAPNSTRSNQPPSLRRETQTNEPEDTELIILALNTLGTFNFSGH